MAASNTEIANLAIAHLGVGKPIANLDTESSSEAVAVRRFYDTARDEMLRLIHWPFARKQVALAEVEETPTDEWGYSYRYPSDCIRIRRIVNTVRNPTIKELDRYWIGRDDTGLLIYSDREDASAEYTYRETVVERYPSDFVIALSYRLAAYAAPLITRGDPFKLQETVFRLYRLAATTAAANAFNEQRRDDWPEPSLIEARS